MPGNAKLYCTSLPDPHIYNLLVTALDIEDTGLNDLRLDRISGTTAPGHR